MKTIVLALLLLSLLAMSGQACENYCQDDFLYSGSLDRESGECQYSRQQCPYGCENGACLEQTVREQEEARIACPVYCRDNLVYMPREAETSEECAYERTMCEHGCGEDGKECAQAPQIIRDCPDYCRSGIAYHRGLFDTRLNRCTYTRKACETGCDAQSLSCAESAQAPQQREQAVAQQQVVESPPAEEKGETPAREDVQKPSPEPEAQTTIIRLAAQSAFETPKGMIAKKDDILVPITFRGTEGRLNGLLLELRTQEGTINVSERFADALTVGGEDGGEVLEIEVSLENNTPVYNVKVGYATNLFFIFSTTMSVTKRIDARTLKPLGEIRPWWSPLAPLEKPKTPPEKVKKEKHCLDDPGCKKFDIDLCKGTHYCDKSASNEDDWTCTINPATVVTCKPSGEPCKVTTCNPGTGKCEKLNAQEGLKCNADDEKCTKNDQCAHGVCGTGTWDYTDAKCQCANDQDCANHEDGDVCNGTLYCDLWTNQCTLNPATVKSCPSVGDTACLQNTCNPISGGCAMKPILEGKPCDDGNPCTSDDMCVVGKCKPGKNTCECTTSADCGTPADLCSGQYYCNMATGKCALNKAKKVECQSVNDTECMQNTCNPKKGICEMAPINEGGDCNADGNSCTSGDICVAGSCTPGKNTCECQTNADCAALEDGDVCNGTLYCHLWVHQCKLNPATIKTCSSVYDTACSKNTCNPQSGKCSIIPINEGSACDADSYWCTEGDICQAGACSPGKNICQCQKDIDCTVLEDGNSCNGTLFCDKTIGKCAVNPATVQTQCKS